MSESNKKFNYDMTLPSAYNPGFISRQASVYREEQKKAKEHEELKKIQKSKRDPDTSPMGSFYLLEAKNLDTHDFKNIVSMVQDQKSSILEFYDFESSIDASCNLAYPKCRDTVICKFRSDKITEDNLAWVLRFAEDFTINEQPKSIAKPSITKT